MADQRDDDHVFVYMGGDQEVPRHMRDTITHVRIHKSVKIIHARAFCNCRNLVSVEMHDGVEIIQEEAFCFCISLRGIKLPGVKAIERYVFFNCTALENIEFGNKLETIGRLAFAADSALSNIKIPKVKVIEAGAFAECLQMTDLELSEDLERIRQGAFLTCPRLRRIAIPLKDDIFDGGVFNGCHDLSQVDLVGGIRKTIDSLLLDSWRNEMKDGIDRINQVLPDISHTNKTVVTQQWMERVIQRIDHYKSEHYALLKEAMSLLELALWKANLDDNVGYDAAAREGVRVTRGQRKRARKDRCITSGASVVIKNVLPFLKLE